MTAIAPYSKPGPVISDKERVFLKSLMQTGNKTGAAEVAGMTLRMANKILDRSEIIPLIKNYAVTTFVTDLVPAAVARLTEMLKKGADPNRVQLEACKTVLDRVGIIAPKAQEPDKPGGNLDETSIEELQKVVESIRAKLDQAANMPAAIDVTPQDLDFME